MTALGHSFRRALFLSLLRAVDATTRKRLVGEENRALAKAMSPLGSCVMIVWHGHTLSGILAGRGHDLCCLTNGSKDGQIAAEACHAVGWHTIQVIRRDRDKTFAALGPHLEQGRDVLIAGDASRGPPFKMKPGALLLARRYNVPIVPVHCRTNRAVVVSGVWDRHLLPLPGATIELRFGEPVFVDRESPLSREAQLEALEALLPTW